MCDSEHSALTILSFLSFPPHLDEYIKHKHRANLYARSATLPLLHSHQLMLYRRRRSEFQYVHCNSLSGFPETCCDPAAIRFGATALHVWYRTHDIILGNEFTHSHVRASSLCADHSRARRVA